MSVNIKSISHKKSSIVENGGPKLPTAAQLELGELAINFADGYETLSIKNSNNEIVTFTNDLYWKNKELVIANALNDLNSRILNITIPTNVSDLNNDVPYLTSSDLEDTPTENSDKGITSGGVYNYVTEIEEIVASALTDLDERISNIPKPNWNANEASPDGILNKPPVPYYGTSSTAAATAQKSVSIPSIKTLQIGLTIIVKPSVTSTVANSTIKLNDFDAYPMRYNNAAITTSTGSIVWAANIPSIFVFDGTYWVFVGHGLDSNTTYSSMSQSEATTGTATTARTISAKVLHDTINLAIPENIVTGSTTAYTIWCGTQTEYNALQTYDNDTVYLIKET